jgi:HEPN domain-containing protein
MYTGTYAPWENMPKVLRHDEMMHPLKVVIDFFEIEDIAGHRTRLKEWRDYAIKTDCYVNEREGPGMLLHTWEEHVRLLEAMYLLWHEYRNESWQYKPASEEQLAQEKETWDYFPGKLDADQLANPYLVTEQFFKDRGLAVYRDHLYEWLIMAMSKALYQNPDLDAEDIITVYENMLELYEAAWIICQRNSDRPHLIRQKESTLEKTEPAPVEPAAGEPDEVESLEHFNITEQVKHSTGIEARFFKPLYPKPSPACALGLQKVKEDILAHYPTVQLIVYLGSHADPFTCYLLLLVSDEEKREEGHLSTNIEDHLHSLVRTYIILHKTTSALDAMKQGKFFWHEALGRGHVVYRSESLPDFEASVTPLALRREQAQYQWNCWATRQGLALISGAEYYETIDSTRMAAFSLHKATESILKAIIQAVLGYRIQMHNIARLLRLTQLFTDKLLAVFELNTRAGAKEFEFLKSAYAQAQYSDTYEPEEEMIGLQVEKAGKLYHEALMVYNYLMELAEQDLFD